jgi:hypothetical protein
MIWNRPQLICLPFVFIIFIDSIVQSIYSEGYNFSASQEIPRILWISKVHYHIDKSSSLVPVLNRTYLSTASHFLLLLRFILVLPYHLYLGPALFFPLHLSI